VSDSLVLCGVVCSDDLLSGSLKKIPQELIVIGAGTASIYPACFRIDI
jgi:hypothetical protein